MSVHIDLINSLRLLARKHHLIADHPEARMFSFELFIVDIGPFVDYGFGCDYVYGLCGRCIGLGPFFGRRIGRVLHRDAPPCSPTVAVDQSAPSPVRQALAFPWPPLP